MNARVFAIAASRVFDGNTVNHDAAVLIAGDRIAAVVPRGNVPAGTPLRELPGGAWLAPGFIDIQVNGGGDVLFNDAPTPATIRIIAAAHRRFGTTALLPTLISDNREKMKAALEAVAAVVHVEPSVLGIHLEGPFLSPQKPGIHDPRRLRRPDADDFALLTAQRPGVTLITVAPEQTPAGFIAKLAATGVKISLGHSMATYEQTRAAMTEGLTGFTHMFNAMRPLDSREPGPIAAALESSASYYGMIVDGIHVAPAMLRLAVRGAGRPVLVTDAMPPVGGAARSFVLRGEAIDVRDDRSATKEGRLAGSCLDMASAVRNCVRLLQVPLADALRFASTHPAEFIGLGERLGRIAPGYRADLVALDGATIQVIETWVAGARSQGSELTMTDC